MKKFIPKQFLFTLTWVLLLIVMTSAPVQASLTTFNTANCGGFSTCDDSTFLAAIGGPADYFVDFSSTIDATPLPGNGPFDGSKYSSDVIFSTGGGAPSFNVQHGNADSLSAEIGPTPGFSGVLAIDFVSAVSAVGFGTVEFGIIDTIEVFGSGGVSLESFFGVSDSTFDYFGVVADGGDVITRIEMTGEFYAIQNIQFNDAGIEADIDIKFCSDPNAFNCKKKGVLPVTIFGTVDFNVEDIDISSLQLCTEDLSSCTNAPRDWSVADRGDPTSDLGAAMCAIIEVEEGIFEEQDYLNQDGFLDLDAAFEASEVQDMLGTFCSDVKGASSEPLIITGTTLDGTMIFSVPVPNVGTDQLWKANK